MRTASLLTADRASNDLQALSIGVDMQRARRVVTIAIGALFLINIPAAVVASEPTRFYFDHPQARFFLLDAERNIPTLYACLQLAMCAGLGVLHGVLCRMERGRDGFRWLLVGAGFAFLTLDEGLSIHEGLSAVAPTVSILDPAFSWVLLVGPAVLGVAVLLLPWVLRQPSEVQRGLLVGAGLYGFGALALEAAGGVLVEAAGFHHPWYPVVSSCEELAELVGVAVIMLTLLSHLVSRLDGRPISVSGPDADVHTTSAAWR